jgi:hypothetical protein
MARNWPWLVNIIRAEVEPGNERMLKVLVGLGHEDHDASGIADARLYPSDRNSENACWDKSLFLLWSLSHNSQQDSVSD